MAKLGPRGDRIILSGDIEGRDVGRDTEVLHLHPVRVDDAETGSAAEIQLAAGMPQDGILEESAAVHAVLAAIPGRSPGGQDADDVADGRGPDATQGIFGDSHHGAGSVYKLRVSIRIILRQTGRFRQPEHSLAVGQDLITGSMVKQSIHPNNGICGGVEGERTIVADGEQGSVFHDIHVADNHVAGQLGMRIPQQSDGAILRVKPSQASVDRYPEAPVRRFFHETDAVPVRDGTLVGDIHAI